MTSEQMALLSNYVLYAAMALLAVAMIAYAVFLGVARSGIKGARRAEHRVGVPADVGGRGDGTPGGVDIGTDPVAGLESGIGALGSGGLADVHRTGMDGLSQPEVERTDAKSGGLATMTAWLATMCLGVSIVLRGLSVQRPPFSNMFEFAVAASFLVLLVFLALGLKRPLKWLGVFVVTPVLVMLGLAITVWYTEAAELVPSLKSTWLVIHVPVAILATAVFTLAFVVLVLHLVKDRHEKKVAEGTAEPSLLDTLPSAGALDRAAYALNIAAFPLWTFTLIAGAIWGQQAWGVYWSWDPKEVWTFVIWVIYAAYLHSRATSGWSLRRSNTIAVIGYLAIIINFTIVNMFFPGMHSYSGL